MGTPSTGYPHFFLKDRENPRRNPCTCVIGTNHWADEPVEEEK